jgi:hypothetical protein
MHAAPAGGTLLLVGAGDRLSVVVLFVLDIGRVGAGRDER